MKKHKILAMLALVLFVALFCFGDIIMSTALWIFILYFIFQISLLIIVYTLFIKIHRHEKQQLEKNMYNL